MSLSNVDIKKFWFCKEVPPGIKDLKRGQIIMVESFAVQNRLSMYNSYMEPRVFNPNHITTTISFNMMPDRDTVHRASFTGILSTYFMPVTNEQLMKVLYEEKS